MTILLPDAERGLRGAQEPRLRLVPEYVSSAGDEATELAERAGLNLFPWQQWVLAHSLGERPDGKWAATEVGLVVGRQNGKNAILEARELAEVLLIAPLVGPRLVIHSAHQFATALEHFRRLQARVRNSPALLSKVKHRGKRPVGIRESHGEESIEFEDGSRILFKARTSSGGQGAGFTCDLLVWDEAWNLPDATVGMVVPTLAAKTLETPGVQTWYTSQAVNQQSMPYGVHLARIRERGVAGEDPRLFYAEWSVDEAEFAQNPRLAEDPVALEQANPSMGVLISWDHVMWERNGGLPWPEYLAHRLGVGDWPPTSEDAARIIGAEAWAQLAGSARIARNRVFSVDVDPDQSWSTVAAAGRREDDLWQVGVVAHRRGTGWVVDEVKALLSKYDGAQLVLKPRDEIGAILHQFQEAGIPYIAMNDADYGAACGGFFEAVMEKRLRYHSPQPELDAAVAVARTRPLGDNAWKWSRKDSQALITPLVACTNALWGSRTQSAPEVWNLADFARNGDGIATEPTPQSPSPGQSFISLEQVPPSRGLFGP